VARLGVIVPPGAPRIVSLFPAPAIGRIRPEQPARLRLHGFPWTQYGTIPARVARLGDEAQSAMKRVELEPRPDPRSSIQMAHALPGIVEVERVTPAVLVLRAAGR
jgi:membrane fusion protein (multidrug efflux system)